MTLKKYLLAAVFLGIVGGSYAYADNAPQTIDINDHAQEVIKNPEKFWAPASNVKGFPVGTILPYYPHKLIELPTGWYLSAGQVVIDPESPFYKRKLPNLTSDIFIMGTVGLTSFGKTFGRNIIKDDGGHGHDLAREADAISPRNGRPASVRVERAASQRQRDPIVTNLNHVHHIEGSATHNHGRDNRPKSFGLLYIIKIK